MMTPMIHTDARMARRLSQRELVLIFVFWTSLATLSAVNRLIDPRGFGFRGISPVAPVTLTYVESWMWAAITPLVFWLSGRFPLEKTRWMTSVPILFVIGAGVSIVVFVALNFARIELFESLAPRRLPPPFFAPLREIRRFGFLNHFLVYVAVLIAGYAREYYIRDQMRASRTAALQAQLADARLDALRMQLNPHFLFNTLHAIAALVERDPAGVRRMIARLSELLRLTIDADAEHEVTLTEELAFLERYIEIMKIRFQGRMRIDMDVDDDVRDVLVPRLILQPVVENAFEHGAARAAGEGVVSIAAHRRGERLVVTVTDNGPGVDAKAESGVGVANTRARLAELYGSAASFRLTSRTTGGAEAEMALPLRRTR